MKSESNSVRVDKWMWAVRLFKTRSLAADACKKGKVMKGGNNLKPSAEVKVGDVIQVKRPPIVYSFKVLALAQNRMGAKLVPDFMENVTPQDQFEILEMQKYSINGVRDRGTGRPTKRDRRQLMDYTSIDEPNDGFEFGFDDEDDDSDNDFGYVEEDEQ